MELKNSNKATPEINKEQINGLKDERATFNLVTDADYRFSWGAIYRYYIYANLDNEIGATGNENLTKKELFQAFQNYKRENDNDRKVSDLLRELYLRIRKEDKMYPSRKIAFDSTSNAQYYGAHFWATMESEKMSIEVNNPQSIYSSYFPYNRTYNPENIGTCILYTAIHEMTHDTQCVNILKALNGQQLSKPDVVGSLINLHQVTGLVNIPYKYQYIEFDANFNAIKTMFEAFKDGNLKDDYNNKMLLYRNILDVLKIDKEKIKENNLMYFDVANDYLDLTRDIDLRKLLSQCSGGAVESFKNNIDDRFKQLHSMRRELERYLMTNKTKEMDEAIERLHKDNNAFTAYPVSILTDVIKDEDFSLEKCNVFNKYLASAYYSCHMLKKQIVSKKFDEEELGMTM